MLTFGRIRPPSTPPVRFGQRYLLLTGHAGVVALAELVEQLRVWNRLDEHGVLIVFVPFLDIGFRQCPMLQSEPADWATYLAATAAPASSLTAR